MWLDSRQKHAGMTNMTSETYLCRPVVRVLAGLQGCRVAGREDEPATRQGFASRLSYDMALKSEFTLHGGDGALRLFAFAPRFVPVVFPACGAADSRGTQAELLIVHERCGRESSQDL